MAARFEIASDAAATTWEDITGIVNWQGARFAGTADRGTIDTGSGFDLLDDAGTRILPKRRRVRVIEDATSPDTTLWQGRTVGAGLARGVIRTADSKMFDVQLVDVNADFGGIGFAGVQRPEEDDTDRIQYLLDTYLQGQNRDSTVIGDTYFSTANPYILKAHLYSNVQLIEWFTHITDTTNRQFFLTNEYDLFYDTIESTAYAAGITITDTAYDFSTAFPPGDPHATEDATEMFTRVRTLGKDKRLVTVIRSAVETANDQWGTSIVDETLDTTAELTARANRFLDEFDHEQTTFACFVDLPANQVDALSWGMTVSFRSAACGILSPTIFRVSRLSWELVTPGIWRAHCELNYPTKFKRRSVGGGSGNPGTPPTTAPLPFVPGGGAASEFEAAIGSAAFGYPAAPDGNYAWFTESGGSLVALEQGAQYRLVFDQTTSFYSPLNGYGFMLDAYILVSPDTEGGGHPASYATDWLDPDTMTGVGFIPYSIPAPWTLGSHTETPWRIWDGTDGETVDFAIYSSGALSGFYGYELGGVLRLEKQGGAAGEDDPVGTPAQGQPVIEPIGADGTADPGSPTTFPYAPLSLIVFGNGVNLAAELTELDPTAGTYEFANDIPEGMELVRYYLGTGGII